MSRFEIPLRLELTLAFLGYAVITQARHLPDGVSLVGYVVGFLLLLLIPLSILEEIDPSSASEPK